MGWNWVIYYVKIGAGFGGFLILFGVALYAGQEDPLFEAIESYLYKYRQLIEEEDVTIQSGIIRLELDGRRTNLKSQLLLGFFSVGRAIQKSSYPFREVQIIIYYNIKGSQQLAVTAGVEKVLKLAQGRLGSDQFFTEIGY